MAARHRSHSPLSVGPAWIEQGQSDRPWLRRLDCCGDGDFCTIGCAPAGVGWADEGSKPPQGEILDQALISYIDYVKEGLHDPGAFEKNYGTTVSTPQLVQWDLCREMSFRVAWKPYMYNDSLPWLLRGVQSKALIVRGDADRIVPASAAALYAERLPNARSETIAGAGHLIEMEQPTALARLIASFIASN